jgi:hypothetical protein
MSRDGTTKAKCSDKQGIIVYEVVHKSFSQGLALREHATYHLRSQRNVRHDIKEVTPRIGLNNLTYHLKTPKPTRSTHPIDTLSASTMHDHAHAPNNALFQPNAKCTPKKLHQTVTKRTTSKL